MCGLRAGRRPRGRPTGPGGALSIAHENCKSSADYRKATASRRPARRLPAPASGPNAARRRARTGRAERE
ncbi:hypothetical protein ISF6_0283 [Piscinibacter sakaiensis]|uniref:Uncharacterized protein n=1 Tax=Piscinibacter sakaiensis TaxID=1547922 RepID=A0A0K8NXZ0_PISS1|nr:hypothetical protein ISF6_0283 [Piscinibacter sakaiensis]